ncbi:MAG: hypothetical protein IIB08_04910 [Bacteroidetes bacterium]|nr:hypothetical protein [Bacteroidota bacterium]
MDGYLIESRIGDETDLENEFFEIIVNITYPEIEQFINDYIKGTKPLPYVE